MIIPFCACGFLVWTDWARVRRVEYVTGLVKEELKVEAASPTGYAGGIRSLVVPGQNNDSYRWIVQTGQMLSRKEWRVRHVDYDDAPSGHAVNTASPYRWWLGLVAWADHTISGRPVSLAVERAALLADPLAHLLLLAGTTIFVAWRFGALAAGLLSLGLVTVFPLAGGFLPGLPDDHGMGLACALWSVLLLLAGIGAGTAKPSAKDEAEEVGLAQANHRSRRWFFAAGVMGGLGLWIGVAGQGPILAGIALGALLAAWVGRDAAAANPADGAEAARWRAWALGGAMTTLAAYLVEYFPSHLGSWQLRVIHPLYAVAWLGGGELLWRMTAWIRWGNRVWNLRAVGVALLAAVALAALPVVMGKTHNQGFLAADLLSAKLTKLPDGVVATSFLAWLIHDGFTLAVCTTLLPVLLVLPAGWLVLRRPTGMASREALALALGPVLVALGFAWRQLSWWNEVDGMLLALLIATTVAVRESLSPRFTRWVWPGAVAVVLAFGASQLRVPAEAGAAKTLTEPEAKGLIGRDLAHWLARQAGPAGAVVLAPPNETAAMYYYGGLRGLATLDWENQGGIVAAIRIASATTAEEALELIRRREITHIIIPSWDSSLDQYAELGLGQLEGTFISRLHQWALPPWLRPMPYQFPTLQGMEAQSAVILAVVDEQDDGVRFSRQAEYFVEMGQPDLAASLVPTLRRFPADLSAMVALLDIQLAGGDTAGFTQTFNTLLPRLAKGADRALPWDRRVALAVVLARGKQTDLAREQVRRCFTEVDEAGLRSLSSGSLYRLQVLGKAFGLAIADPRLQALALDLTPPEMRSRL